MSIISKDGTQSLKLYVNYDFDEEINGYFVIPAYTKAIFGKMKNEFGFLDDEVFGGNINFLLNKWAENKFPVFDIEGMTDGCNVLKALSFRIKPIIVSPKSDSITLAAKFALITANDNQKKEFELNFNVKLFYKLIHTALDKKITFDFLKQFFPDYEIYLDISRETHRNQIMEVSPLIYDEIQKSLKDVYPDNYSFDFTTQLGVYPSSENGIWQYLNFLSYHQQGGVEKKFFVVKKNGLDTLKLEKPIYYARIKFPFLLLNREKAKLYMNYRTRQDCFTSDYEFLLIPIELNKDTLTVDVITIYSKLTLDDFVQRWSPFKKRLKIIPIYGSSMEFPKENWSANFSIGKEKYDIYGHSDYEKFVKELLFIKLDKISKEN